MRSLRRRVIFASRNGHWRPACPQAHRANRSSSPSSSSSHKMVATDLPDFLIPWYFCSAPLLLDSLRTETSSTQEETVRKCLPFLKCTADPKRNPFDFNNYGVPPLDRAEHVGYLKDALGEFPAGFVAADASRPWMVYWALTALYLLGEDVSSYSSRVLKTLAPMQNPSGGIGGGHGQYSHCAGSYAALLSLALVGGRQAYAMIDREKMWQWLGRLKQQDGGFQVCEGGEEDVRGAYCAMVIISLLNLPLDLPLDAPARQHGVESFTDGLGEYLSRCQTYEGGIAGAPGNEAHGAYAFCAIACLCMLGEPHITLQRFIDLPMLLAWLSSRQYAPEGGFAGRTNKLVDGCYSHWVGGCWPLIQASLNGPIAFSDLEASRLYGSLYSREGLTRYILSCCQAPTGGLKDKPSKPPDSYHTCYTLAGLSSIQHVNYYEPTSSADPFASAFAWRNVPTAGGVESDRDVFGDDKVQPIHPIYVVPHAAASNMRWWSEMQPWKSAGTV